MMGRERGTEGESEGGHHQCGTPPREEDELRSPLLRRRNRCVQSAISHRSI